MALKTFELETGGLLIEYTSPGGVDKYELQRHIGNGKLEIIATASEFWMLTKIVEFLPKKKHYRNVVRAGMERFGGFGSRAGGQMARGS